MPNRCNEISINFFGYPSFAVAASKLHGITAIDYFFAKELSQAIFDACCEQKIAVLNDSHQQQQFFHLLIALNVSLRAGHSCLPIDEVQDSTVFSSFNAQSEQQFHGIVFDTKATLLTLLDALPIHNEDQQPIVYAQQRLYLRRYYQFEQELKQNVAQRKQIASSLSTHQHIDNEQIKQVLLALFPKDEGSNEQVDWQEIAVANAINKDFCIIAGGPGTGKTYTVTKLLAALLMLAGDTAPRISLVAPTGKAAQRLSESIISAVKGFRHKIDDNILNQIPEQAQTIHRLLGVIPNQVNFRHHRDNMLPVDILLIDEVSMVDLPMMTRIFRALPAHTKVVLLGDADQLPSVAVGSVLADLAPRPHDGYSAINHRYLTQVTHCEHLAKSHEQNSFNQETTQQQYSMSDCVTFLLKSRRFDGDGEIGKIAQWVIQGDYTNSWTLLSKSEHVEEQSTKQLDKLSDDVNQWLPTLVERYYQPLFQCVHVSHAFEQLAKFRILSATRKGPQGVESFNEMVTDILRDKGLITYNKGFYQSQPIMIFENDYRLGVFNGDIGIMWRNEQGRLMAVFEQANGEYQWIMPSRLPKFETVYAMTIHKTQGSEFTHVAMVLPEQKDNKLLSRELLYTGITRAKTKLSIASNESIWRNGVSQQVNRFSGLSHHL